MAQGLVEKVKHYMKETGMLDVGKSWILAISGGPDSMALLDVFSRMRVPMGWDLVVAHVNHGLREEAEAEQRFVEEQANLRGLRWVSFRKDVRACRQTGQSLEECAREVRYTCLEQARVEALATGILVAHHQDDGAETVLLHLLRGTGLGGLKGLRPVQGRIFRPFLCVGRQEIMAYVQERGLPFCEDASNEDTYYTRNRIRKVLLPLLKDAFNPQIVAALNRLADVAEEDERALKQWTEEVWPQVCVSSAADELALDLWKLLDLPLGIQRRVVRKALALLTDAKGWTARDVQDILSLTAKSGSNRKISLKKGLICQNIYGKLHLYASDRPQPQAFCVPVQGEGRITIGENGRNYWFVRKEKSQLTPHEPGLKLDAEKLPQRLWLRSRRPGDRFYPAGGTGGKKLKDWMIDRKISVWERDQMALLSGEDGTIYAVCGQAVSSWAAPTEQTRWVLLLRESE